MIFSRSMINPKRDKNGLGMRKTISPIHCISGIVPYWRRWRAVNLFTRRQPRLRSDIPVVSRAYALAKNVILWRFLSVRAHSLRLDTLAAKDGIPTALYGLRSKL